MPVPWIKPMFKGSTYDLAPLQGQSKYWILMKQFPFLINCFSWLKLLLQRSPTHLVPWYLLNQDAMRYVNCHCAWSHPVGAPDKTNIGTTHNTEVLWLPIFTPPGALGGGRYRNEILKKLLLYNLFILYPCVTFRTSLLCMECLVFYKIATHRYQKYCDLFPSNRTGVPCRNRLTLDS